MRRVMGSGCYVGIVASAHQFVEYHKVLTETEYECARCRHASHIATAVERPDTCGVGLIFFVFRGFSVVGIELQRWAYRHVHPLHI